MDYYQGKVLEGRYEIQEVLGVGGMAIVYRAYDNIDDRPVAVKILKEEYLANDEFRRRFKNESKAIAMLSHPNIVKVYDVSYGDRLQYIVMEYVEGITLKEYIEQRRVIPWKEAVHFLTQILRALQHAHDRGIVHRDIKPQNIMLLHSGNIKVTDFGIARFSRSETRTMTENAIGSVHYISPEQARGDFTDEKADIYSIGVVFYEMLTGQLPFQADSTVSVAIMQLQSEPRRPREINDAIPVGLEQIIIRAMQKNTADRYQSAAEMLLDLEEFKRNPLIRFEYSYFVDREPTKYVGPMERSRTAPKAYAPPAQKPSIAVDEEDEPKSRIVPMMIGIIAGIVVLVGIVAAIILAVNNQASAVEVPKFINMTRADIETKSDEYTDTFVFVWKEELNDAANPSVVFRQDPEPGSKVKPKDGKVTVTLTVAIETTSTVPDVVGFSVADAEAEVENNGFVAVVLTEFSTTVKKGDIVRTDPKSGTKLERNKTVKIYMAVDEDTQNKTKVPDLLGWTVEQAKTMLSQRELLLDEATVQEVDSTEAKGKIVWQSLDAEKEVPKNTKVSVRVSSGKAAVARLSLQIALPNQQGEGVLRVYLNAVRKIQENVLLDGSNFTVEVEGSGSAENLQVTLDGTAIYTATVDFTKTPPAATEIKQTEPTPSIPSLVGKQRAEAIAILEGLGYTNIIVTESSLPISIAFVSGMVMAQTPTPGSYPTNTQITLDVLK
ncbi:MAG: Stk1 family PASTA domain-containing Ser/Thr kinase [Oscillospiraceae bacterium]|jgi:serine/threonine-protein kinase|nr:Stk1 family PASTA domain-containing Ser/Thr kinase [Oscillospiraceae bacterium]